MKSEDIITRFLEIAAASCHSFTEDIALSIEQQLRNEYGGETLRYIAKKRPLDPVAVQEAVQEAKRSGRVRAASEKHGISRATIYRLLRMGEK